MSRRIIELKEWETLDVPLDDGDVAALVGHPQRPVLVEASAIRNCWKLRAQAMVGAIRFTGFDLIIRPKAGLRNVFYLMGVQRPRDWWGKDEVDLLARDDLFAGIARLLAHAVERAFGQGVQHGYVERRDPLVALRGRIDLREQFRHPAIPVPLDCRYDDYTPDTRLNQLIRAALAAVLRLPGVPGTVRRTLHLQLSMLDQVSVAEPDLRWADDWQPTRLDRRYLPAVRLSAILLRHLALSEAAGGTRSCSFLVDMNDLFERFIEEGLRKHLQAADNAIRVIGQEEVHLDTGKLLRIRPDVVIKRGSSAIFVVDAKYVLAGGRVTNVNHHMQMLAYAIRHGVNDVALVYARDPATKASVADLAVTIYNAGVRIHSWSLDLRQGPDQLDAELARIAGRILQTIHAPHPRV